MFILVRNLSTTLKFSFHEIDKLANPEEIFKRLKLKVQHHCHSSFGYIIQVVFMVNENHHPRHIPAVEDDHCSVIVQFSAICFKRKQFMYEAEKNDILDIVVNFVHEDFIRGNIGPAQVLIPGSKLTNEVCYHKEEGIFVIKNRNETKIDIGSKIRCQCLEVKTEMSHQMKIVACINKKLLPYLIPS